MSRPACGIGRSFSARNVVGRKRERVRGESASRMVADLKLPHMVGRSSTMAGRGACPLLEDGTGLRRRGFHGRELQGLEAARMRLLRGLRGKWSYIVRRGKRRCRTLLGCRVTKAGWCRRRGGPGYCTAGRSRGTSCNADKTDSTLDELMRSRSSSTGNLIGGDTLAGRCAIASSSVKRHS